MRLAVCDQELFSTRKNLVGLTYVSEDFDEYRLKLEDYRPITASQSEKKSKTAAKLTLPSPAQPN